MGRKRGAERERFIFFSFNESAQIILLILIRFKLLISAQYPNCDYKSIDAFLCTFSRQFCLTSVQCLVRDQMPLFAMIRYRPITVVQRSDEIVASVAKRAHR